MTQRFSFCGRSLFRKSIGLPRLQNRSRPCDLFILSLLGRVFPLIQAMKQENNLVAVERHKRSEEHFLVFTRFGGTWIIMPEGQDCMQGLAYSKLE